MVIIIIIIIIIMSTLRHCKHVLFNDLILSDLSQIIRYILSTV